MQAINYSFVLDMLVDIIDSDTSRQFLGSIAQKQKISVSELLQKKID